MMFTSSSSSVLRKSLVLSNHGFVRLSGGVGLGVGSIVGMVHHQYNDNSSSRSSAIGSKRWIHVENRIKELGITLPKAAGPRANYDVIQYDEESRIMYVSGHLPFKEDGTLMTGTLTTPGPRPAGVEHGYQAARHCALNIVSTLQFKLGKHGYDLDQIESIQKVFGIVQSHPDFKEQHLVMDGASDVLLEIFGEKVGYHARSAIGTNTLPLDMTVELEAIVKIKSRLRYAIGQTVECKTGPLETDWEVGVITQLNYKEQEWEHSAPYQVRLLDDNNQVGSRYIFAPEDSEYIIREIDHT
eukprot:CAMPEP_0170991426 /NCGR_PEP_ID=MMETSP0736-20130129/9108_1 /TAXON_ID=186038 /ORGANISM="Fragilariopsis kerguelensis, Strain L26-C5" /LENGTH=298 /DNA_ID=CAMNT_0011416625 /DNA_START=65 /DNA_END=957 /DNA_ORIENTATION=-